MRDATWRKLERSLGWLAVPKIGVLLVTLQGLGFLLVMNDPIWVQRLLLYPPAVREGEYWRLITFLSLPLSDSPLWVIFALWFLYFVVDLIEANWGAFKTTLYVLVSLVITWVFSFAFDYPVTQITYFESTLFLAAGALAPEMEVQMFFVVPIKLQWLAWLMAGIFIVPRLIYGGWVDRIFVLVFYSNFLLFFGPAFLASIRQRIRKNKYLRK